ncbi:hypothetical protein JTB14_014253 [Gonioctena quinquepunctata]|nr:hypothetical protein JTB14_014253 [Gonioctena quinquepunctata]
MSSREARLNCRILEIAGKILKGLKWVMSVESLFLGIGITYEVFHIEGKYLASIHYEDRPEADLENGVVPQIENFDKPGPSHQPQNTSPTQVNFVSPEILRPYPKAAPRKVKGGRKEGKPRILTDTPEKDAMEMKHLVRLAKESKNRVKKKSDQESFCRKFR